MCLLPFIQIYILNAVIGGDLKGLKIAIVDHEISGYQDCFNTSLVFAVPLNDSCHFEKVSCRFMAEINELDLTKVFYTSVEEALKDAKSQKFAAVLKFDSKYSKALTELDKNAEDSEVIDNSRIKVHMDNNDMLIVGFVKSKLLIAYRNYAEKLMESCGLSKRLLNLPMNFENSLDVNMKLFQVPGMIFQ